jgi:hypothetical protein
MNLGVASCDYASVLRRQSSEAGNKHFCVERRALLAATPLGTIIQIPEYHIEDSR